MKSSHSPEARAARLQDFMLHTIPQVAHMQVRVAAVDSGGLTLTAPLAPNINHEQTAFGGSLASIATLACWGYLWLLLEHTPDLHVVVNEVRIRYIKPVTGTLTARCAAPDMAEQDKFLHQLLRRGKARLELGATIIEDGALCADFRGNFVAYRERLVSP